MTEQYGEHNTDFTIITSFIDNECTVDEKNYVLNRIEKDSDFKLHYELEKNFTINFRKKVKKSHPSKEICDKITELIEQETKRRLNLTTKNSISIKTFTKFIYPIAALFIIFISFYLISKYNDNSKDFVTRSHDIYEKVLKNEINLKHITSDADELEKILTKEADFRVFIPDVKEAKLIGGIVNDINGCKVVHFLHKSFDKIIYTMQIKRNDIINSEQFTLRNNQKQEILSGINWVECEKDVDDCTVIWFKNDVICTSISKLEAKEIATVLTNYK